MTKAKHKPDNLGRVGRIFRAVRKAERQSGDGSELGGTGYTILKLRQPPVGLLVEKGMIGPEEFEAAQEISLAYYAMSSRLSCRGVSYERVDGGRVDHAEWPARTAKAVARYQHFAKVWTARHSAYGDPTLEILIDAVIEERPIRTIALDHGYRVAKIERVIVGGLRDFAARAGAVTHGKAEAWQDAARVIFGPGNAVLHEAIRRARVEV